MFEILFMLPRKWPIVLVGFTPFPQRRSRFTGIAGARRAKKRRIAARKGGA